jgi:hypothetical protein
MHESGRVVGFCDTPHLSPLLLEQQPVPGEAHRLLCKGKCSDPSVERRMLADCTKFPANPDVGAGF